MEGEIERGEGKEREKWKPRRGIRKEKNESNSEDRRREEMRRAEYKIQYALMDYHVILCTTCINMHPNKFALAYVLVCS